ncbi:hypothetical protein BD324DRAFT_100562 [Kockovaella imperatae]|uniref:Ubiquitin-like domain-containing protein n=1 Tax=Kockovaella imperatae TaxID=4999 RepID=A0A1Y1UBN6_9TREE|nr:hypothetical protein BD324DRAFT_100562 [Kockovaella imperatae]ORX35458.1 hypothetical protein BD324DRAFT_100562 [Kockovaella imperatae]
MRLTIIAPDSLYEHDVDPSMEVQDIQALIEAETGLASPNFILSTDNGVTMNEVKRSLGSYDLKGENGTIFLTFRDLPSAPSGPSGSSSSSTPGFPTNDAELERMRLQALGDPNLMRELRLVS